MQYLLIHGITAPLDTRYYSTFLVMYEIKEATNPFRFIAQEYSLDKIGGREPLEEEDNITRAMLALVATGTRVKR